MKKIIMFVLSGLLFIGCYENETIHADYMEYGRIYDTTSTDPVLKYISQYYYKFGKLLIVDPDTADYIFNFQSKYDVHIVPPKQEGNHIERGLELLKELFLNGYSDQVKQELFPYALIMADTIENTFKDEYVNIYTADRYIAFLVNDQILDRTEKGKEELSREWNNTFLNYSMDKVGWVVPEEFYLYSETEYGNKENWWIPIEGATEKDTADINIVWERGYPTGNWTYYYDDTWTNKIWGYAVSSSRTGYLEKFFEFLFTTPQETINKAVADHEKLRKAHDVLDQALKDDFGIDYRTMVYKAKN
ncbi:MULTISPECIES: hypothetical protein [Butyricimonas]|jgi:lipoprotein|uniref:Uncharacterized protein n=1 Tax=Butyricimonas faecihominis TaxID=1472416 RepID=A0A7W6HV20_9BACT|nr:MULTISPECIES: hypothetical protein [Butyricimonas]MBS6687121.1 hypothetical protein [Sanguibacteroides justesenii]KAB1508980.1 hypothetical protein F8R21_00120 [Butyricimonas faecihominis]MBB4024978.1 hypothetical protein [Butyricimonas faecihominis]WOF08525.1 hypothetical protein F1611_09045 [Butyricimonas faecihominis]BEI55331.1 hypothetical protein Bfae18676_03060 [Butyricimonas faecihominis]